MTITRKERRFFCGSQIFVLNTSLAMQLMPLINANELLINSVNMRFN